MKEMLTALRHLVTCRLTKCQFVRHRVILAHFWIVLLCRTKAATDHLK